MSQIQVDAVFKIRSGKLEEFKLAAARCMALVKEKDTDTQQYDWFFSADRNECIVRETFKSSEALLAHLGHLGDALGKIIELGEISVSLYGDPSPALKEATAGLSPRIYSRFQGLE